MSNKEGKSRKLGDIHDILCALEQGSVLTRYFPKKHPESRTFRVMLQTRELAWMRSSGAKVEGVGMLHIVLGCRVLKCLFWLNKLMTSHLSILPTTKLVNLWQLSLITLKSGLD